MRLEKWFVSNLDASQKRVVEEDIDKGLIVQGVAGSGKTNLAIHRALQASKRGSYAIVIFSVALKRMVAYGMQAMGLDRERIAYEWAWLHRGFDIVGDLYMEKDNNQLLYLVNDMNIRKFVRTEKAPSAYGVDFETWVPDRFYKAFGRRVSWFAEVIYDGGLDVTNEERFELIPGGILYKQSEQVLDYLVVDEGQDFSVDAYKTNLCPRAKKSLTVFGDSAQQMLRRSIVPGKAYKHGSSMSEIAQVLGDSYKCMTLDYNYRVPISIAKFAQQMMGGMVDLVSNNMRGIDGPRPVIVKCQSKEAELDAIIGKIGAEDLDDVAILVESNDQAIFVNNYLDVKGIKTQTFFRSRNEVPYDTINTLDFSNGDLPCVLTYYAAKGSEFDNVFIPFASNANRCGRNDFYVACTRSSRNLVISFTGVRIHHLDGMDPQLFDEYQI